MRDKLLLIVVSLVTAAFAWAFWHYLGQNAFTTLSMIMLVVLSADNYRLRRKLAREQSTLIGPH